MEHEALLTYKKWSREHQIELCAVECYWKAKVVLIFALKEGAMFTFVTLTTKEESKKGEQRSSSLDEGVTSKECKEKVLT